MTDEGKNEETRAIVPYRPVRARLAKAADVVGTLAPLTAAFGVTVTARLAGSYDDPLLWFGIVVGAMGLATLLRKADEFASSRLEALVGTWDDDGPEE